MNAHLIAFGGLLLFAGRLEDLIGRKRTFMIGLIVFTSASVLCGLAQSQWMLIVARFIQGGRRDDLLRDPGDDRHDVSAPGRAGQSDGVYSFVASAGGSIGLLAGGALTQAIGWHWTPRSDIGPPDA